jgi:hypothetical protein
MRDGQRCIAGEDLDHRSTAVARGPCFLKATAISNTRRVSNTGEIYSVWDGGSGASDLFVCYPEIHFSMIAKLETGTGHELHSSPNPHRDSSDPRVQPLACVRQAARSSIERAACALGHFLGRRRWHWAAPAFGSRAEQSRADLQSSRSGTAVRLPQSTGLVRSADVAMANGADRVPGRICLTSFCWAS